MDDQRLNAFRLQVIGHVGNDFLFIRPRKFRDDNRGGRQVEVATVYVDVQGFQPPFVLVAAFVKRIRLSGTGTDEALTVQAANLGNQLAIVAKDQRIRRKETLVIPRHDDVRPEALRRLPIKPDTLNPEGQEDTIRVAVAMHIRENGMKTRIENRGVNRISLRLMNELIGQLHVSQHFVTAVPELLNAAKSLTVSQTDCSDRLVKRFDG